jgi:hypothetical protein
VEIEQVEMTKLLGVTLHCKLSWSKHIDAGVDKMGRSLSIIMRCSAFLTPSTKHVLQALVLSYLTVVWSGATKKDGTQRANFNKMHVNLSWLKVEERLTSSLIIHQVIVQAVKLDLKNTIWNSRDCEATQTLAKTHTHAHTHTITYKHMDLLLW